MREKELMHDHLEELRHAFGKDTVMITLKDAAKYLGCDTRTLQADSTFPIKQQGRLYKVPLINLARWLA